MFLLLYVLLPLITYQSTLYSLPEAYLKCYVKATRSITSDMVPASSKKFLEVQANYRVRIHSQTRTCRDNNIQSNASYR